MEKLIYLDTHVVVWMYAGELSEFSSHLQETLAQNPLIISPIVLLELQYLLEIGRIKVGPEKIFKSLEKSVGLKICDLDFNKVVTESIKQTWTRDPFDRLIVAQAAIKKATLVTKDTTILKHYSKVVWNP